MSSIVMHNGQVPIDAGVEAAIGDGELLVPVCGDQRPRVVFLRERCAAERSELAVQAVGELVWVCPASGRPAAVHPGHPAAEPAVHQGQPRGQQRVLEQGEEQRR